MGLKKSERKKNFLSIDWDYFINATAEERLLYFPDSGNEKFSEAIRQIIWGNRYADSKLKEIGVREREYAVLQDLIVDFVDNWFMNEDFKPQMCLVGDSHMHLYDMVIKNTTPNEYFSVYNIDHHHDCYHYRAPGEPVNCGNWANELMTQRPHMKYFWTKNDDSEVKDIAGDEVKYNNIDLEELLTVSFDGLFVCRSAMWSPPHLDPYFLKALEPVFENLPHMQEQGIKEPRNYDDYARSFEEDRKNLERGVL